MNYYNPYTGSRKKKLLRRICTVLVAVVLITAVTVIFGNYLNKKAENSAANDHAGIGREDIHEDEEAPVIIPPSEGGAGSTETVKGVCVPLGEAFAERLVASSGGYTGALIPLTGEGGYLLYNSLRAGEYSRLPVNPNIPQMSDLAAAVSEARGRGLRVCALMTSSARVTDDETGYAAAVAADARIAADALEAGFDELIISSLVSGPEDISGETAHIILRYINQIVAASGSTSVVIALPPSVYETAALFPQIELFVSRGVSLALELTAEQSTPEYLGYICEKLAGTVSVYNMRMLFAPSDTATVSGLEGKLREAVHENYLFTCVPDNTPTGDETSGSQDSRPDDE